MSVKHRTDATPSKTPLVFGRRAHRGPGTPRGAKRQTAAPAGEHIAQQLERAALALFEVAAQLDHMTTSDYVEKVLAVHHPETAEGARRIMAKYAKLPEATTTVRNQGGVQ